MAIVEPLYDIVIIPFGRTEDKGLWTSKFGRILTGTALVKGIPGEKYILRKGKTWQKNAGYPFYFAKFTKHERCMADKDEGIS